MRTLNTFSLTLADVFGMWLCEWMSVCGVWHCSNDLPTMLYRNHRPPTYGHYYMMDWLRLDGLKLKDLELNLDVHNMTCGEHTHINMKTQINLFFQQFINQVFFIQWYILYQYIQHPHLFLILLKSRWSCWCLLYHQNRGWWVQI